MHKYYHKADDVPLDSTSEDGVAVSLAAGEFQLGRKIGPGTEMYDLSDFFFFYICVFIMYNAYIVCIYTKIYICIHI